MKDTSTSMGFAMGIVSARIVKMSLYVEYSSFSPSQRTVGQAVVWKEGLANVSDFCLLHD